MPDIDIDARRFRPNIVIGHPVEPPEKDKIATFAEDYWEKIKVQNIEIIINKPCERCNIPSINPDTLAVNRSVHDYFKQYRMFNRRLLFGVCGSATKSAILHLGDSITPT